MDGRRLADVMYRSGRDHPLTKQPPPIQSHYDSHLRHNHFLINLHQISLHYNRPLLVQKKRSQNSYTYTIKASSLWNRRGQSKALLQSSRKRLFPLLKFSRRYSWSMWEKPKPLQQHSTSIRYDFKDPFLQKENVQDENFQFFKFISPTIDTWTCRSMIQIF